MLMKNLMIKNSDFRRNRRGVVLLITVVLLVILSSLGYVLSSRIAAHRHRVHYIIDYSSARYACDSAIKFALSLIVDVNAANLIARPNEPDFSDLFSLSEEEYREFREEWAAQKAEDARQKRLEEAEDRADERKKRRDAFSGIFGESKDSNDVNDVNEGDEFVFKTFESSGDMNDPNNLVIPGPYGPPWPLVTAPVNFEIGSATVRVEIEDENAKYPFGWVLLEDEDISREVEAGFETFCEWMDIDKSDIESLKVQAEDIQEVKEFKLEFKSIKIPETREQRKARIRKSRRQRRGFGRKGKRVRESDKKGSSSRPTLPASTHISDFARIFHSSMVDTGVLGRATVDSDDRKESALKYMGMWGSVKVNVNTAPRHVLEAAFVFGGDSEKIAEEIIVQRQKKPFKNIKELKNKLLRYSDSIRKCEEYITTVSRFFTVRVTARCGVSSVSAVIAVIKDGSEIKKIAVIGS